MKLLSRIKQDAATLKTLSGPPETGIYLGLL